MSPVAADPVVEVKGVTKRYAEHLAVDGLSLSVRGGIIYGLLGPNGAGKTTSIRMINDIVKPDEGRIQLFGALAPGREALRRIGYLPEERGLYPKMTVRRMLAFLGELRGLSRSDVGPRIERWMARLELTAWLDRKVESLSKGMQQKVQFVAAVIHEPDLLVLDEPFSGLDPINADLLRDIVREQRARGKTILFSTHLMEHAEQMCDDVCILARSRKVLEGQLRAIKRVAQQERNGVIVELAGASSEEVPPALRPGQGTGIVSARATAAGYELSLEPGASTSALLRRLLDAGHEVLRFEHAAPTLHEIFVSKVQERPRDPRPVVAVAPSAEVV
jgi:ABC-2 type transport system ATP-binding protein